MFNLEDIGSGLSWRGMGSDRSNCSRYTPASKPDMRRELIRYSAAQRPYNHTRLLY